MKNRGVGRLIAVGALGYVAVKIPGWLGGERGQKKEAEKAPAENAYQNKGENQFHAVTALRQLCLLRLLTRAGIPGS